MSEILTAEQVAVFHDNYIPGTGIPALCDSHEAFRDLYDALLQGSTAQRVATLMDEADRMKDAFPADSVWDQHAVQCGNCGVWLIAKNGPLKSNGFPSNGLSDTVQSEDEALCGMCAGAEMYRLMDESDSAQVEIDRWMKDSQEWQSCAEDWSQRYLVQTARIAELEKSLAFVQRDADAARNREDAAIAERDGLLRAIEADGPHGEDCDYLLDVLRECIESARRSCNCWKARALAAAPAPATRDDRQREVHDWCSSAFGADHAASIPQRGIRLLEEAIEACQSAGCDLEMARKLVDYVFSKPAGNLAQELGGVGITLLALAEAAGVSADAEEARELGRVKAFPLSHFKARNEVKNAAGFNVGWSAPIAPSPLPGQDDPPHDTSLVAVLRELVEWVDSRIEAEVTYRPDINVHKRTLSETWHQVRRKLVEMHGTAAAHAPTSPESPLISTLRYLIALDLPKAELLDRLVQAVRDSNTTVDGRPLTAAEMRHEGECT